MLVAQEEKQKDKRLELWCECCGEKADRWDMDMVQPSHDFILASEDFNFACPVCVTERRLIPLQTEQAVKFRTRNEKLREVLAPAPIH